MSPNSARRVVGDSGVNIMPPCHIDVDMTSSQHQGMIIKNAFPYNCKLRDLQSRVSVTPRHSGERKKRKITALNLTDRLRMILRHARTRTENRRVAQNGTEAAHL